MDLEVPEVIYDNQQITFNCSAVGVSAVNISWWLDGTLLQEGSNGQLVDMISLSWNGACLTCRVELNDGTVANASSVLTVASK